MWKILKKNSNKNLETYYFKDNATRDCDGWVVDFNSAKNTKVQIDKDRMLLYFEENKNEYVWKIISEIKENVAFNLKQFTVETELKERKRIIIFNNVKMTIRNEELIDGVKRIYGKPGSLYEEYSEYLGKIG